MAKLIFKQKCVLCKKNYVLMNSRYQKPYCFDCQRADVEAEVEDPVLKEMFDIPIEWYKENAFLRSIKVNYVRYGGDLTEKQIEAFKSTVEKLKNPEADEDKK